MTGKMCTCSLNIKLIECSKVRYLIQQTKGNQYFSDANYPYKIWSVFLKNLVVILYRIDLLEDCGQGIIPELICFIQTSIGKPKISIIVSILNLRIRIFTCFRILQLNVDLIVFIYYIFYEIFAFLYVFRLLSKFSQHLLVMLSKLLHVLLQIFLGHDLFTCIPGNFVLYSITLVCLQLQKFLLLI